MSESARTDVTTSLIVERRVIRFPFPRRIGAPVVAATVTFLVFGAALLAAEDPPPGRYGLEIVSHETPSSIEQWDTTTVPLVLRNEGTGAWDPATFHVAYHWLTPQGEILEWDGDRTPLPAIVEAGGDVRIDARLRAPKKAGRFLVQWDVVDEGVAWISRYDSTPATPLAVSVTPGVLTHGFTILQHDTPTLMVSAQRRDVAMRLRNDGTETWQPDERINVSYHWQHRDPDRVVFDGARTALPHAVRTGEEVDLAVTIEAPHAAGVYTLQWDMVHEDVTWFDAFDPTPAPGIRVLVLPNPLRGPRGAFVVSLFLLGLTLYATSRPERPAWLLAAASVADLLWLGFALLLKQSVILDEAARQAVDGHLLVVAAGAASIVIATALVPRVARPWLVIAINAAVSLLLLADLVYLRFFGDVISLGALGAAGQTAQVRQSITSLLSARDVWLFLDLFSGLAIAWHVTRLRRQTSTRPTLWLAICLTPLLVPGLLTLYRISDETAGKFVQVFQNMFIVQEIGIVNYHLFDAWTEVRDAVRREPVTTERIAEIETWFRETTSRRAGVAPWFGSARGANLLMIQVESMQSFVIGLEIEGREVTPNLNRWRDSGQVWFSSCVDQTAQGRTADGEFVTQTSLFPSRTGAVAFRYEENRYVALGDVLEEHGYETISAVPFHGAFWNRLVTHPEYGYGTSFFEDDFAEGARVGWGLNDLDFLRQMAPRLEDASEPFAAWLITLSNHHPYESFPDELKELDLGSLEGTAIGNYLHSMHLFDRAFAAFIGELERAGRLDHTLIALWGDHTAGLPWDERLSAVTGAPATEKNYYIVEQVPLFIRAPGVTLPSGVAPCGQTDVAPTLLALLGIDPGPYPYLGRNLFGEPAGPVVRRYGAWIDDRNLYISKGPELEAGRCYDLADLSLIPVERCRASHEESREQLDISRDIIRNDLQELLTAALQRKRSGDGPSPLR